MKKIIRNIFLAVLVVLFYDAFAQGDQLPHNNPLPAVNQGKPGIKTIMGGTAHLINGECTIKIDEVMPAENYFISITPHGLSNSLYVVKNSGSFIVKESPGAGLTDIDFDYLVFVNGIQMK